MLDQRVRFNNFQAEPAELRARELAAVQEVIASGWWVLGNQVKQFEAEWSKRCQVDGAVGVASGLDALEIGLRTLGIGAGDEVITTSVTAFATILAIQRVGAIPVFAEIDLQTACLDVNSVARCISQNTKAVLVVHLYGRAADVEALADLCASHQLLLLEDCAQAHLAAVQGRPVGSFGAFGAWSFYPTKNLGAIGDAGAITSQSRDLLDQAAKIRNYGQTDRYHHEIEGQNSRLDELQAAILLVRLQDLEQWTQRRREIAMAYWHGIHNPALELLMQPQDPASHVHHLFVLRTKERARFQHAMADSGIDTLIHYPVPSHLQQALRGHRLDPEGLPNTVQHCDQCCSLPVHPGLADAEVQRVIEACNAWS